MNVLHLDSSILAKGSVSRQLSTAVTDRLRSHDAHLALTYRDLAAAPIPHLTAESLAARKHVSSIEHDDKDGDTAASAAVLAEFLAADVIVIGVAFYNFTIPSQLKAWIDRILVVDQTFSYTKEGPRGLAGGKRVILAIARGGLYGPDQPSASSEHAETYLRAVFAFIGIPHVEVFAADGLAMGPEQREQSISTTLLNIARL